MRPFDKEYLKKLPKQVEGDKERAKKIRDDLQSIVIENLTSRGDVFGGQLFFDFGYILAKYEVALFDYAHSLGRFEEAKKMLEFLSGKKIDVEEEQDVNEVKEAKEE